MQTDTVIVTAFLGFLLINATWLALIVRRGRVLCDELALRFPAQYEALGRPRPGLWYSARRTRYMRFVMQAEYEQLGDPHLEAGFAAQRSSEMRQLVFVLVGFGMLGAAAVWYEFLRAT